MRAVYVKWMYNVKLISAMVTYVTAQTLYIVSWFSNDSPTILRFKDKADGANN